MSGATGRPGEIIVGVGAIVVRDGALLLVRRAKDPAKGRWSLPGGRLEKGELLADAVAREVMEETGLRVRTGGLVGVFEVPGDPHYVIHDYAARVVGEAVPRPAGDVDLARWVPLEEVPRLPSTPRLVETLRGWGVLPSADE